MLSQEGLYGPARSHLILAAEESIKTIMLLTGLVYRNAEFMDLGFVFNHKERLILAAALGTPFELLQKVRTKIQVPGLTKAKMKQWQKQTITNLEAGRSSLLRLMEWWVTAGELRNAGFYLDYRDGSWKSPGRISKSS